MNNFTPEQIAAMATEAGIKLSPAQFTGVQEAEVDEFTLANFAALVAAKAAEQERESLFGAGPQLDGQMRLQLTRWEDGQCFAAAAQFTEEQTHCGGDDLLHWAVERLDDNLDACIAAAIRARGEKEGA
jgi:hypothetical protein